MADKPVSPYTLDELFSSTPLGSLDKAIGNNLYGINHIQSPSVIPSSKDSYGLTFFVRPQLNLQSDNIRNLRLLTPLLTNQPLTIQHAVRCMLDPRMMAGYRSGGYNIPPMRSPVIDNQNAFFAILTNNLQSISGWPDTTLPVWSSKPGLYKEVFTMPDGLTRNFGTYTLDATFRNSLGSPIIYLFHIWETYMSYVKKGDILPYPDYNHTNTLDYCTRIYRLVLDQQRNTVTSVFSNGWGYPISNPLGTIADFNKETPYNEQIKDLSIRFQSHGFEVLDDILVFEFNATVCIFNPAMKDANRDTHMKKMSKMERLYFKNRGYPRINTNTFELEWWVPNQMYQEYMGKALPAEQNFDGYENLGD